MSANNNNEPSKLNANYNSAMGTAKETIGNLTGYKDLEASGAQQRREGDVEYKAAQAQGYAEGTKDRVGGKVDNVIGAVTGDKQQQFSGSAREKSGKTQQQINS